MVSTYVTVFGGHVMVTAGLLAGFGAVIFFLACCRRDFRPLRLSCCLLFPLFFWTAPAVVQFPTFAYIFLHSLPLRVPPLLGANTSKALSAFRRAEVLLFRLKGIPSGIPGIPTAFFAVFPSGDLRLSPLGALLPVASVVSAFSVIRPRIMR